MRSHIGYIVLIILLNIYTNFNQDFMKKATITILLLCVFKLSFSQDIYTYLDNTAGIPTYVDPLITTYTNLTPVGTGFTTPCTWGFSGIDGFTAISYTSSGPCIEITLTAALGYTITSNGFTAGLRRSSTGPVSARMAYSTDGTTWIDEGLDHFPLNATCATSTSGTTLASWTTFSVSNNVLHFRIYPFGASGMGGTIQIYGLNIIGNVHLACTTPAVSVSPSSSSICPGSTGTVMTSTGAGIGGIYTWSPSAGLSSTTGAVVTAAPSVTTVYTVTGTTSLGCFDTAIATIVVLPSPTATITTSGPTTFCSGDSVHLTANSGIGYTYLWYNGTTAITGATNLNYTATVSGNYTVVVTNSSGCSATSLPEIISVIPIPSSIITATGSTTFCTGGNVTLSVPTVAGNTYQWYVGGSPVSGAIAPAFTTSVSGTYSVHISNIAGCSSVSSPIGVYAVNTPYLDTVGLVTTFCKGGNCVLHVNTGGVTSGITYQWKCNGVNIAGAVGSMYIASTTGDYTCLVNVGSGGCVVSTIIARVRVNPLPNPIVSFNGSVFSTAFYYSGYQWYVNTISIPGATTYTVSSAGPGSYRVNVTDSNGCVGYSAPYTYSRVAVQSAEASVIKVYPNPATDVLHILSVDDVSAIITDIDGRLLSEHKNVKDISLLNLNSGLYILTISNSKGDIISTTKFVKL